MLIYILSMAAFVKHWQGWIAVTETVRSTMPVFTYLVPYRKKFADPCFILLLRDITLIDFQILNHTVFLG